MISPTKKKNVDREENRTKDKPTLAFNASGSRERESIK